MFRHITFFLALAVLHLGSLWAQNAPRWVTDKELEYPNNRFIAAVGQGGTRAIAQSHAVAQISMFFNTTTQVRNEVIQEFNEAVQNNTTEFSRKTYINENAVISSEEEFLGVRFANPWEDSKNRTWAVLAYINKSEAAQMYDSKISINMTAINAFLNDAKQENEVLYAASLLHRAVRLCDITEEFIKSAAVVDPQSGQKYRNHTAVIAESRSLYHTKRGALSFSVTVNSEDANGRIDRKLRALLEDNDYAVSESGGLYKVNARLSMEEEEIGSTSFVTPGIAIRVERGGRTVFSYSKTLNRSSSRSGMKNARTRAFFEVEQDLEDNFIGKFTAMLGK